MEEIICLKLGVFQTNCYLIKENHHVLIIDPAAKHEKILEQLSEDDHVDAIILTHGHFDHLKAVDKLVKELKCPVYLNKNDEVLSRDERLNSMAHYGGTIHCPIRDLVEPKMKIGTFDLEIIHAPGHTEGSTLIQYKNHLFVGDVLFKNAIGRTDLYSGSNSKMRQSLRLFRNFDPETLVYPGHDELTTIEAEIKNNPYL